MWGTSRGLGVLGRLAGLSGRVPGRPDARGNLKAAVGLGTGLVLLTLLGGVLVFLEQSRSTAVRNAKAELERNVRVAENIFNRQLLQVDGALASMPTLLSNAARAADGPISPEKATQLLFGLNFQTFAFRDLVLVAPDGEVWAAARPRPRKRPLPVDVTPGKAAGAATRVIGPTRNPATGEWAIFLARTVTVPGAGKMEAVAEVTVSAIMTPLADIANMPGSRLFIEREGGHVVGSIPHDEMLVGATRRGADLTANGRSVEVPRPDGSVASIEARRRTLYSDLSVVMQVEWEAALADWMRDRDRLLVVVALAATLVLALAATLLSALLRKARLEAAQKEALSTLEEAIEAMSDGFVMWDRDDRLVTCNQVYRDLYSESAQFIRPGVSFEDVVRRGAEAGQYPQAGKDLDGFVKGIVEWHRAGQGSFERLLPDGRWLLVTERRTAGGGTVGIRTDITRLKQALNELAEANARVRETMTTLQTQNDALRDRDLSLRAQYVLFDTALNNMSHGLLMVDSEQRVIVCNSRFRDIFHVKPSSPVHGLSLREVFMRPPHDDFDYEARVAEIRDRQQELALYRSAGTFVVYMENGHAIAITQRPMHDGGFVAIYEDVTEQKRAESRIRFLAHHDALTNLPNRVTFRGSLEGMVQQLKAGGRKLALLYLDLDRFKDVNDTLGHQIGDALLEAVGQRLRHCLRESDVVARLGGDEFAIAFVSQEGHDAELAAANLAQRIIEQLSKPYGLEGQTVTVGASVGIATADDADVNVDTVLKCADMALYAAKDEGRGRYCIFMPEMEEQLRTRLKIEHDIKTALANDEFRVVYQPLVDLENECIIGYEALLRWECAGRGIISPAEFIPLAEELDLIKEIGAWCLQRACRDMSAWQGDAKIAVNLSPVQLRNDDIVDIVRDALAASGLTPARLELEITESALLEDSEQIVARLHLLHALGVRIVLDDFGTGFSSLNYLRAFPFDKIKIDKVFVIEATSRPDCEAIVQSVVQLAERLGMTTTAEGIETKEQLELVQRLGCTEGQGFLLGRPQSILSVMTALEAQTRPETEPLPQPLAAAAV